MAEVQNLLKEYRNIALILPEIQGCVKDFFVPCPCSQSSKMDFLFQGDAPINMIVNVML